MAGFHSLRQRIDFILEGEHMHTFSRRATAGLFIVVSLALGVSPGFGESGATESEAKAIAVPEKFERLRVIGRVDVSIQFGNSHKVMLAATNGARPSFIVDDENTLVISLDETSRTPTNHTRPKVVITTPKIVVVEAKANAAVTVHKVKAPVIVFAVEGHSRVAADGHCESLTVAADKSGTFLGKKLAAVSAVVTAKRKSAISVGKVRSLVQNSDATSKIDSVDGNVVSVRLSNP